ncbi:MAG TPA: hypothetical protein PKY05_07935, partial [Fibrobacteria bacterium]|nr:hypothetical protein [Fibrobacteria bacterium]
MLLAISLLALQGAAQPPVPDLFRPDPSLRFLDPRGQLLPDEAKRIPLAVEAIDTFELRARKVEVQEALEMIGSEEDPSSKHTDWPFRIRMSRPRDSLTTWTAWLDLDRPAQKMHGGFMEIEVVAGPSTFRPTTSAIQCDSIRARTLVLVSDLGLVATRSGDSLDLLALDLARGTPWAGVDLERLGAPPWKGRTDAQGRARVADPQDRDETWVARTRGTPQRIAVLELAQDESGRLGQRREFEVLGGIARTQTFPDGIRLFPYLFRKFHLPGDTLVAGMVVRGPGGIAPRRGTFSVKARDGKKILGQASIAPDAFGHAQWRMPLPLVDASPRIYLDISFGAASDRLTALVGGLRLPRLRLGVDTGRSDSILEVSAAWSTGQALGRAPVRIVHRFRSRFEGRNYRRDPFPVPATWNSWNSTGPDSVQLDTLDERGHLRVRTPRPSPLMYGFHGCRSTTIEVFEEGGTFTDTTLPPVCGVWTEGPGLNAYRVSDSLIEVTPAWIDHRDSLVGDVPVILRLLYDRELLAEVGWFSGKPWMLDAKLPQRRFDDLSTSKRLTLVACAEDRVRCVSEPLILHGSESRGVWWDRADEFPYDHTETILPAGPHPELSPREVRTGDSAQLRWESSKPGLAWVEVHQGRRVLRRELRAVRTGTNLWKSLVDSTWWPGVQVVVLEFTPSRDTSSWVRSHGLRLDVLGDSIPPGISIASDSVFKPGGTARVQVLNPRGITGSIVLSVLDQGYLQAAPQTPLDPSETFDSPESDGAVQWWDATGSRANAYHRWSQGECSTEPHWFQDIVLSGGGGKLALGAGGNGNSLSTYGRASVLSASNDGPPAHLVRPLSYTSAIRPLAAGANTFSVPIPARIGAARVQALVATGTGARTLDTTLPVRSRLEGSTSLPYRLSPDDTALVATAFRGRPGENATASLKTWGGIRTTGSSTIRGTTDSAGRLSGRIDLVAGTASGGVGLVLGQGSDTNTLFEAVSVDDPRSRTTRASKSVSVSGKLEIASPAGIATKGSQTWLELSDRRILGIPSRLSGLGSYPHGCLEQTVSKALARLFLADLRGDLADSTRTRIQGELEEAIASLSRFPKFEGLLGLWPSSVRPDPLASLWAGHALAIAWERNLYTSRDLLEGIASASYGIRLSDPVEEAWRLQLVPRLKRGAMLDDTGSIDSLSARSIPREARLLLAAAWERRSRHDRALAEMDRARATPDSLSRRRRLDRTSPLRDQAWALEAALFLSDRKEQERILGRIAPALQGDTWISTFETALLGNALARIAGTDRSSAKTSLRWRADGGAWHRIDSIGHSRTVGLEGAPSRVEIEGSATGSLLDARLVRAGRRMETLPASRGGISLKVVPVFA